MTSAKVTEAPEEGYERGLGSRQVQMIAIGGAIGVGLFMGAGANIAKAGPSIILMYALAGVVIFFIMRALGELLLYRPVSGSFAEYAREFLGPFFGFVTGWTYWLMWVVTGMAELTAAAIYIHFWFPEIPQWVSALVFLVVLFGVNLISVKIFGEVEFWFSMIKVTAIIGMIVIGLGVLTLGFSDAGDTAAVSNLWSHDGFFPNGIGSSLMTLQGVMFAYLAVELVGVTAGESENPEKTLPKAINTLPWRIIVFYVGALLVILSVVRWTEFSAGESPFVHAFGKIGIPLAAGIVNFVVLTAALSSCNSGMYSTAPDAARPRRQQRGPAGLRPAQRPQDARRRHRRLRGTHGHRRDPQLRRPGEGVRLRHLRRHRGRHLDLDDDPRQPHPLPPRRRGRPAARLVLPRPGRRPVQLGRPHLPDRRHRHDRGGRGRPRLSVRGGRLGRRPGRRLDRAQEGQPGDRGPRREPVREGRLTTPKDAGARGALVAFPAAARSRRPASGPFRTTPRYGTARLLILSPC
ncbi:L-asparagine transporter-like permease [Streptomyces albogriseolus]